MIYDLTHAVTDGMPVYAGDPTVQIEQVGKLDSDGFLDHKLTMGTHVGTHMDAPAHMIAGGKELKDFAIDRFVVDAVCIDARTGFSAEQITNAVNTEGVGVLFYTGASEYYLEGRYWHDYIVLPPEIIDHQKSWNRRHGYRQF
jgi:arylformamidase